MQNPILGIFLMFVVVAILAAINVFGIWGEDQAPDRQSSVAFARDEAPQEG